MFYYSYVLQIHRGQLKDGLLVSIRSVKMTKSYSTQDFMHNIELISKYRHLHLVSVLGHCFECYLDDSSVSSIFVVFEYVPNGTLKSWISGYSQKLFSQSQIGECENDIVPTRNRKQWSV